MNTDPYNPVLTDIHIYMYQKPWYTDTIADVTRVQPCTAAWEQLLSDDLTLGVLKVQLTISDWEKIHRQLNTMSIPTSLWNLDDELFSAYQQISGILCFGSFGCNTLVVLLAEYAC